MEPFKITIFTLKAESTGQASSMQTNLSEKFQRERKALKCYRCGQAFFIFGFALETGKLVLSLSPLSLYLPLPLSFSLSLSPLSAKVPTGEHFKFFSFSFQVCVSPLDDSTFILTFCVFVFCFKRKKQSESFLLRTFRSSRFTHKLNCET